MWTVAVWMICCSNFTICNVGSWWYSTVSSWLLLWWWIYQVSIQGQYSARGCCWNCWHIASSNYCEFSETKFCNVINYFVIVLLTFSSGLIYDIVKWASVCPVSCGKMTEQILIPLGLVGCAVWLEVLIAHGKGQFGVDVGRPIVANGKLWRCCKRMH